MTLIKFGNEVLSRGPAGVLPQNLSLEWLTGMQSMADDFLDRYYAGSETAAPEEIVNPVLSACVTEILHFRQNGNARSGAADVSRELSLYAIEITIESERRASGLAIDPPTLDDILTSGRLAYLTRAYPSLEPLLADMGLG